VNPARTFDGRGQHLGVPARDEPCGTQSEDNLAGARYQAPRGSNGVSGSKLPASVAMLYWSRRFGALLAPGGSPTAWPAGKVIGLEHEYRVFEGTRAVDFRSLVHRLDLARPRLDPADPSAYRLASGAALTADEAEAEIALPPTLVRQGCGYRLAEAAASERRDLLSRLPARARLEGYSTHISVAVRPSCSVMIAKLYATTFSAALMLLMDSASSPGLLVRPRPSRLELGGEFVDGDRLAIAAIFAVGSVRACQRRLERGAGLAGFPERLRVEVERDDQRYGWFVCRSAFATDLYLGGRFAQLARRRGSTISAQAHLERCWAAARPTLVEDISEKELDLVDMVVFGTVPLPAPTPSVARTDDSCVETSFFTRDAADGGFGFALEAHSRPGYELAPVMLTWDRAVFVVSNPTRDRFAYANVPAPLLRNFASQLDEGILDKTITSYLALPSRRRRLDGASTATKAALFDHLAPRAGLLVPERKPRAAGRQRKRFGSAAMGRRRPRRARADNRGSKGNP
jgi:hypothetical protein